MAQEEAVSHTPERSDSLGEKETSFDVSQFSEKALDFLLDYGPQILLSLIIILLGFKLSSILAQWTGNIMRKSNMDVSLRRFLRNFMAVALKILVLITAATAAGIPTTTFITIIGAAGLAIGLALKDSLSNFAGGVLLLALKPFKVGDLIEVEGFYGNVEAVQIFNTIIQTRDQKTVSIPNGIVANGPITTYTATPLFRVSVPVGIGYQDDIQKARRTLLEITQNDERIKETPEPTVVVKELGESAVNIELRVWCDSEIYRRVQFDLTERAKIALDKAGVSIPYPQRDVYLRTQTAAEALS